MQTARTHRSLIVWTLFSCVLFSLFVCGIHHWQMKAPQLFGQSAADGASASHHPTHHGHGHGHHASDQDTHSAHGHIDTCPLCSSFALALLTSNTGASFAQPLAVSLLHRDALGGFHPPPRHLWPSLNPRASPHTLRHS